jgi:Na+/proline symporter
MALSRGATIFWGLVLFGLAIITQFGGQRVLELGLSIASVPYGGLLGVFLLGVLTKRANQTGALIGMACGLLVNLFLFFGPRLHLMTTVVAWTWYVTIGTTLTFVVGYLASIIFEKGNNPEREAALKNASISSHA